MACVQVETRPFVLVEAQTQDGASFSTLLQNAETVRLVGPTAAGGTSDEQVGMLLCSCSTPKRSLR